MLFENAKPAVECPIKESFFIGQYLNDLFFVRVELRENGSEFADHGRRQLSKEAAGTEPEIATEQNRPPQDSSDDVVPIGIAWDNAIRNRKTKCPDVVGDDSKGDVDLFLLAQIVPAGGQGCTILRPAQLSDGAEDRPKDFAFIV